MQTRNEFGVKLDKNGYAPSLFVHESFRCYRCHRFGDTARHEIYGGSRRKASKALGLWVNVCPACHAAIHGSGELQAHYHKQGQQGEHPALFALAAPPHLRKAHGPGLLQILRRLIFRLW